MAYALAGKLVSSNPYVLITHAEMVWETGTQSKTLYKETALIPVLIDTFLLLVFVLFPCHFNHSSEWEQGKEDLFGFTVSGGL